MTFEDTFASPQCDAQYRGAPIAITGNREEIYVSAYLAVPNVSVNSTNGVVTLAGQVNTATDRAKAGQIAASVPKVVRVDNNLQVTPRPAT